MQHTWQIHNLERQLIDDLVLTASYCCKTSFSGSYQKTVGDYFLPSKSPSDPDFISYNNLTEEIVLAWVTGSIDYLDIESSNSASIAEQINLEQNKTIDTGIPW
jgi:hypothetical protein